MVYEIGIDKLKKIFNVVVHDNIKTIFEVGARDCLESIELSKRFPDAEIFSFECNPSTLPQCKTNIVSYPKSSSIHLIESAVSNKVGTISFFQIDQEKTLTSISDGNPGASSLFEASGEYPIETYCQKEITVPTTTLSTEMEQRNITSIDLLWMDVQGAELLVLEGAEEKISNIKVIHTEVNFFMIYKNQPLFTDVQNFLYKKGFLLFTFTTFGKYAGDAVFINKYFVKKHLYLWLLLKSYTQYRMRSCYQKLKEFIKLCIKKAFWYKRIIIEKVWVHYALFKNKGKKTIYIKK